MKVKSKIAILLSAMILSISVFAGCGSEDNTNSTNNSSNQQIVSDTSNNNKDDNNSKIDDTSSENTESTASQSQTGEKADISYFDDVVFIGDSVSYKLKLYNDSHDVMGNAKFLTSGSLGYGNALWSLDNPEAVFPSYQGDTVLLEDGVALTGAKKVYIMLGMNDVALYGIDGTIENMKTLTGKILEKSPDVEIYLESVTPILNGMEGKVWNNENINIFNGKLKDYCNTQDNFYFVDVASVMKDSDGCLVPEYCSDPDTMGIHFTDKACEVWIDYILTHTN